jgi:sugar lactone lactonase YvrE
VRVLVAPNGDILIVEKNGLRIRRIRKDNGLVDTVPVGRRDPEFHARRAERRRRRRGEQHLHRRLRRAPRVPGDPARRDDQLRGDRRPRLLGRGQQAANAQLNFPACVVAAPGGVVYICDKANNRIRRVQGGTITTIAGTGVAGFNGDGPGATATLSEPEDAVIVGGNLVFSDQENNRIRQINLANNTVTTLAGTGPANFAGENAPALSSTLASPMGVAATADGKILFAERDAHRVRVLAGGVINTVAGDGVNSFGGDGGPALDATFRLVEGVAQDTAGNLYVSDSGNNRIRKVDAATGAVSTIAGNGTTTFGVDEVPATVVGLDGPSDVVVDAAGNVIFSDTRHQRVRSVSPDGKIHTIAGTGVAGASGDGGPANQAQLSSPTGLALDASGNLYIADFLNHCIRKVDTAGNISRVAGDGTGVGGFNSDGLAATATQLNNPTDVAFDATGNMFIADMRNNRVRRVDAASGTVSTIAGTGQELSSDDFIPAVTASLKLPTDVAVDADGNVLIADSGSNRIRRVNSDAVIDTVVGSRVPGDAGDGGPAALARLLTPLRMARAGSGLLIVDHDNHKIRAFGDVSGGGGGGGGGGGNGDPDCTKGSCSAGGGNKKTDCFLEFNTGLGSGSRITCKDGDPSCDTDSTPRQCTVKVGLCLGVADPRLGKCTPASVRSVQFLKGSASLAQSLAVSSRRPSAAGRSRS